MLLLDRRRQHDDLARARAAPARSRASSRSRWPASAAPCAAARSRPATGRDAIRRRASPGRRARGACPAPRLPATPRRARGRARTAPGASRARPPCRRRARHDGTRPRRAPATPAAPRPPRAGASRSSPRAIRRAAGVSRTRDALSTSAVSAGMPASRAARSGPRERGARRLRPQAPHRDPRDDQLVGGPQRGREGRGVERGERALGLVEAADQQQAPDLEIARMRGVDPVAVRFERRPRRVERLGGPAEVARDERDLGLGDDAPRAGHRLSRAEGARRAVAAAPSPERDRRAAPSRCRAARAPARRRAGRPGSARRADHPPRARAPQR